MSMTSGQVLAASSASPFLVLLDVRLTKAVCSHHLLIGGESLGVFGRQTLLSISNAARPISTLQAQTV